MIFADTGFWLALSNKRDQHHRAAESWLRAVREPLLTTEFVLLELTPLQFRVRGD